MASSGAAHDGHGDEDRDERSGLRTLPNPPRRLAADDWDPGALMQGTRSRSSRPPSESVPPPPGGVLTPPAFGPAAGAPRFLRILIWVGALVAGALVSYLLLPGQAEPGPGSAAPAPVSQSQTNGAGRTGRSVPRALSPRAVSRSAEASPAVAPERPEPRSAEGGGAVLPAPLRPHTGPRSARSERPAHADRVREATPQSSRQAPSPPASRQALPEPAPETAARLAASETSPRPKTPSRDDVQNAIRAVMPAVEACAEGRRGVATADITVAPSGRVTTASVSGTFVGSPVGSCIARAVRKARFPAFTEPRFKVRYPFQL